MIIIIMVQKRVEHGLNGLNGLRVTETTIGNSFNVLC